jgi:imidazolonepropionase-like amidohydrolase
MSAAGVRIVTGTDCGAEASQITPFGHATHRELQMYAEAGMPPLAAIRAATLDAARVITRVEDPDYGSIRVGKAADLLLLDADTIDRRHQQCDQIAAGNALSGRGINWRDRW